MRKALLGVLVVVLVGAAAVVFAQTKRAAGPRPPSPKCQEKKETAALKIHLHGGDCQLKETPEELRAINGQEVYFVIKGSCNNNDVLTVTAANPKEDPFERVDSVPAADGQILTALLKGGSGAAHFRYQVTVAKKGSATVGATGIGEGDLYVCPVWPCTEIKPPVKPKKP